MCSRTHKQVLGGFLVSLILSGLIGPAGAASSSDEFQQKQDAASEKFQAWQAAMFQQRQEIARQQLRLFHRNMKVPPPLPPSARPDPAGLGADDPPMMRIDVPLPLPVDAQVTLWAGEPSASVQVVAEGKALSFVGASYTAGVTYCAEDNKWLVGDAADFKLAYDAGSAEITGTYQYHASQWTPSSGLRDTSGKRGGLEIAAALWKAKGSLGYNANNELSVGLGYDVVKTPQALSWLAEVSLGVQGQVSVPVKMGGLTRGRSWSASLNNQVARLVKLLMEPVTCPQCQAKGELDCGTCRNTRTVTCTQCRGQRQAKCPRCEGGGQLYCGTCRGDTRVPCGACGGSGQLRCSTCGGRGQNTVYESETQSRQVRKLLSAGFDENGQPYERWGYETEYYTVQVPKQQTCTTCGGSGRGGECGRCAGSGKVICDRCGGTGTVSCPKCGGSGQIPCSKCRGTGKIACPECRGKPIRCPVCQGKKQLGK